MFDIRLNKPNQTDVLIDDRAFANGFLWLPLPFRRSIMPRGQGRAKVVEREWAEADGNLTLVLAEGKLA